MRRLTAVTLVVILLAACSRVPEPVGSVSGRLVAGPTCPVETDPPDPNCAAALVAGAVITVLLPNGEELTTESDVEGRFEFDVPAGGITLHFGEVEGLMGTPDDVTVQVIEGESLDVGDMAYDTGIR